MSNDVKESGEYDNFLGQKNVTEVNDLSAFGIEVEGGDPQAAEAHWVGMPEFEQESNGPYKSIQVHFRTADDYKEFSKLIGQIITPKTKSIWHPKNEVTKNSLLRWVEDNNDES